MTYYHHQHTGQILDDEDGQIIATMSESATPQQAELLAAAPKMLAALIDAVDALKIHCPESWVLIQAQAAIKEVSP